MDSLLNALREPLLILGADLKVRKASQPFYRIFKVSPEETLGRPLFELSNRQWNVPRLRTLLENGLSEPSRNYNLEFELAFPNSVRKTILVTARRISSVDDQGEQIVLAFEDITELRQSRYFSLSHDLLCVSTLDGFFVEVNPSFQEVLGYSRSDLLSKPFLEFVHPDDREKTNEAMAQLRSGRDLSHFLNRYRCLDGSYRWFDWNCPVPLLGEQLLFAAARDMTDSILIEHQRQEMAAELRRSNADLEQFAYVASHDLQEPLRAVSGCVQIIRKRYDMLLDAGADELIGHVIEGVDRMQALINDLLAYSRLSRAGHAFVATDLNDALDQVLKHLETSLDESQAIVTRDPLPTVFADRGQMVRLLQNLLSNALKFRSPSRPLIHVGAERIGRSWRLSVRDNGIGIQEEYLERIFVLFQRLHTRTEYPGNGVGLAICKRIVERHGGQISVESRPGEGSTFFCVIPDKEILP